MAGRSSYSGAGSRGQQDGSRDRDDNAHHIPDPGAGSDDEHQGEDDGDGDDDDDPDNPRIPVAATNRGRGPACFTMMSVPTFILDRDAAASWANQPAAHVGSPASKADATDAFAEPPAVSSTANDSSRIDLWVLGSSSSSPLPLAQSTRAQQSSGTRSTPATSAAPTPTKRCGSPKGKSSASKRARISGTPSPSIPPRSLGPHRQSAPVLLPNVLSADADCNMSRGTSTLVRTLPRIMHQRAEGEKWTISPWVVISQLVHTTALVSGEQVEYVSSNTVEDVAEGEETLYTSEYLASLHPNGFPPHKLHLTVGMPIMLIRNISPKSGCATGRA